MLIKIKIIASLGLELVSLILDSTKICYGINSVLEKGALLRLQEMALLVNQLLIQLNLVGPVKEVGVEGALSTCHHQVGKW